MFSYRNTRCRRTLCAGDAFRNRKDHFLAFLDHFLSNALPGAPKAYLLLPYVVMPQARLSAPLMACAGTMSEIEKALQELKSYMAFRTKHLGKEEENFRGLGLTSRKNLCLNPSVKREKSSTVVDARCRALTAGFQKEKKARGERVDSCIYHDVGWQTMATWLVGNGLLMKCRIWILWSRAITYHLGSTRLMIF